MTAPEILRTSAWAHRFVATQYIGPPDRLNGYSSFDRKTQRRGQQTEIDLIQVSRKELTGEFPNLLVRLNPVEPNGSEMAAIKLQREIPSGLCSVGRQKIEENLADLPTLFPQIRLHLFKLILRT